MLSENIKNKRIFIASIIELIIQIFLILLSILVIVVYSKTTTGYKDLEGNISFPLAPIWISFLVVLSIFFVMNTILSSVILFSNWESEYSHKNNKLWGLLSMFLLGAVSILVFSKKSIKFNKKVEIQNEIRN